MLPKEERGSWQSLRHFFFFFFKEWLKFDMETFSWLNLVFQSAGQIFEQTFWVNSMFQVEFCMLCVCVRVCA